MGSSVQRRQMARSLHRNTRPRQRRRHSLSSRKRSTTTTAGRDDLKTEGAMGRKKKRKDKGVLEYISPKNRKDVKALIRELGLELVSVERIPDDYDDPGK